MVPVHADNPLGAIGVYWCEKRKAGRQQLELLERLADIAGIALTNAQLFAREQAAH
jgi:putative two-component system response regulator